MDLHVPVPSSADGLYDLADTSPPAPPPAVKLPAPAEAETAKPAQGAEAAAPPRETESAKPKAKAGFGSLFKKGKAKEPAPADAGEAKTETASATSEAAAAPDPAAKPNKTKRKRRRALRTAAPAWMVSMVVHVVVLTALGLATFSSEVKQVVANINSALISTSGRDVEMTPIYADPSNQKSEEAVGSEGAPSAGESSGGGGGFSGIGSGPPSATPRVAGVGNGIGEKSSLPGIKIVANMSGLSLLPSTAKLGVDLGGGGMIGGDVSYEASDVGVALDQLAREILRHLGQHKLTVVWLFDESESMKDDQKAVKAKFDRIVSELKVNVDPGKKAAGALTHSIVGFGKDLHFELEKPTPNVDVIDSAIDRLKIDDTGIENTMEAITSIINHYSVLIKKDRKLLIVLVTDESGDDGSHVEEAHQAVMSRGVPIYVIGRQSLFGYDRAHLKYIDPVTKDVYWPTIRRGPETADVETLQWDGLHDRWDEQPSGFAPYELARLAKDSGGIYFLLPSEENMRVRQREKAYSIKTLKEYIPDYESRAAYAERRNKSEFRRTLYEIIQGTKAFPFRRHFPIFPEQMVPLATEEGLVSDNRYKVLVDIQKRLMSLRKLRDLEPDKRWQADYDLMLAQIVAYQVKAFEYGATMKELVTTKPRPKTMPTPDLVVEWVIDHSHDRKAPKEKTDKIYAEADKLLREVIAKHPKTPWADLAQDEFDRGFGTQRNEWHHNPKYDERAKLVPKY